MTEPPLMSDGSERVTRRRAVASLVVHGRDEHAGVLKRHQHSIPLFQCEVISPSAVEPNHPQAGAVFLCSVADLWPCAGVSSIPGPPAGGPDSSPADKTLQ